MEYKHLKTGSSMISWRASARKRVFSVSPLLYYQYLWLRKAANPPDISVVGVRDFYKISNFPTPFQCREFSPVQGQRSQFIPLNSPGWPGVLPQGQADCMCIIDRQNPVLFAKSGSNLRPPVLVFVLRKLRPRVFVFVLLLTFQREFTSREGLSTVRIPFSYKIRQT